MQLSATLPLKLPAALNMMEVEVEIEVEDGLENTVTEDGEGAAILKSTTSKLRPETVCVMLPSEAWITKS